jgi:hypothetical protein
VVVIACELARRDYPPEWKWMQFSAGGCCLTFYLMSIFFERAEWNFCEIIAHASFRYCAFVVLAVPALLRNNMEVSAALTFQRAEYTLTGRQGSHCGCVMYM